MRKWTIGTVVALLLSVGLAGDVRQQTAEAGVDVGALIDEASSAYGVSAVQMRRIAWATEA